MCKFAHDRKTLIIYIAIYMNRWNYNFKRNTNNPVFLRLGILLDEVNINPTI